MAGQATESERKIAGVAKPKKLCSGYPQSDGIRSEKQWQRKDLLKPHLGKPNPPLFLPFFFPSFFIFYYLF
jgi:hypothetical protein